MYMGMSGQCMSRTESRDSEEPYVCHWSFRGSQLEEQAGLFVWYSAGMVEYQQLCGEEVCTNMNGNNDGVVPETAGLAEVPGSLESFWPVLNSPAFLCGMCAG